MSGHTPGPWTVKWAHNIVAPDGSVVANCGGRSANFEPRQSQIISENAANAHLIAAAPELLDACRAALGYVAPLLGCDGSCSEDGCPAHQLRQAIRKAEGIR